MSVQNIKTVRDSERWEVELTGEIPVDTLAKHRVETLRELAREVHIKGFRAGHAPESEILRQFGEEDIMRRATDSAVRAELPELFAQEKLNIVDSPKVTIESVRAETPVSFSARAPLAPEMTLPDYISIAKGHKKELKAVTVTDDEHKETLTHMRRERARIEKIDAGETPEKAGEEARIMDVKDLPLLDDAFVKTLGVEDVATFETKVREQLLHEKETQEHTRHRAALLEKLVKQSKISYPIILKEYELDDMQGRFAEDVARLGRTMEQYLAETKKTLEDIRKEWGPAADSRVKTRLILSEIARRESIEADQAHVSHELEHAKKHYPKADENSLRAHITHALKNEAVMQWLETRE